MLSRKRVVPLFFFFLKLLIELHRRVRHVRALEYMGVPLSPDDELIRDTPREDQLQRILLGLPPIGALPFQSKNTLFVSQQTAEAAARKLLETREEVEKGKKGTRKVYFLRIFSPFLLLTPSASSCSASASSASSIVLR